YVRYAPPPHGACRHGRPCVCNCLGLRVSLLSRRSTAPLAEVPMFRSCVLAVTLLFGLAGACSAQMMPNGTGGPTFGIPTTPAAPESGVPQARSPATYPYRSISAYKVTAVQQAGSTEKKEPAADLKNGNAESYTPGFLRNVMKAYKDEFLPPKKNGDE